MHQTSHDKSPDGRPAKGYHATTHAAERFYSDPDGIDADLFGYIIRPGIIRPTLQGTRLG